jgi:DNA-binding NarL/FixJ family response regulator
VSAFKAGAAGYLLKDVARHDLLGTIGRVLRGEAAMSGAIAPRAPQRAPTKPAGAAIQKPERLTPRERDVASLIARGFTSPRVAEILVISERTADAHADHIRGKLGLHSRAEIAAWAVEHGLARPGPEPSGRG